MCNYVHSFSYTNVRFYCPPQAQFDTNRCKDETQTMFFADNVSTTQENLKNYCNFATKALKHPTT